MDGQLWVLLVPLFFIGALFGSFFNVVGIRVPRGQSVVHPRSSCGSCHQTLGPVDLIPIFGWLLRKGKCHYCGTPISGVYMLGELAGGVLFAALPLLFPDHLEELWIAYPLVSVLLILTVSDLKYMLLPNKIIYPAMLLFTLLRLLNHPLPLWHYALGFVLGGGILISVSLIATWMGKPAMGFGDIRLMALIGLVIGVKLVLLCVFLSALLGSVIGLALIGSGKLSRSTPIPYGPFIAVGSLVSYCYGDPLVSWYLDLITL
ncbi:prepilin peptidase [Paenibacillus cremeus]|uniref:Prepilin leader peptidase/N-methyltransferase n=1 Tax=Paenibacillus cremeus TaxID=2163881 RepID=A0A559KE64_9BACL|nr:A24 family peptidase [Paenibacillus cremeus]TVY10420.1 prepilin peptidase [Paenibacillus cremeus]